MRVVLLLALTAALCGVASAQTACNAAAGVAGPTCAANETCCGSGTMSPSCIPAGSDAQCCQHFLASTTCNSTQTCCGSLGPGASSYAFCCDEGSTCCKSGGSGTQGASCCPAGSQCCAASNLGFCCGADEVCNLNTLSCDKPGRNTSASQPTTVIDPPPSTSAGSVATTTTAAATSAPATSDANEVTTQAPATSSTSAPATTTSDANEMTTQAPAAGGSGSGSECGWVYVDAQLVLNGAGWANVQANADAWSSLSGALVSDLASLLGRSTADVNITALTAAAGSLTVDFTARSNALAEAARIAALIRDDVPASAPLPATLNVYASAGQSSEDVNVASHTATSRDAFACTTMAPATGSDGNAITTAAPPTATSSNPSEVTTQAPATNAPTYPVHCQITLNGGAWLRIIQAVWEALKDALCSDLADALHVSSLNVTITGMAMQGSGLQVNYTIVTDSYAKAGEIAANAADLSSSNSLPATSVVYSNANPGSSSSGGVSVSSASATFATNADASPASSQSAWSSLLLTLSSVVMAAAVLAH